MFEDKRFFKYFYIEVKTTYYKCQQKRIYYPEDFLLKLHHDLVDGAKMIESLFPMYIEKLFKDGSFTYLTPTTEYEVVLYKISKQCTRINDLDSYKKFYDEIYTFLETLHAVSF
ncbi:MAG: hypothetical protein ACI311_06805 [Bacilli bacterium]